MAATNPPNIWANYVPPRGQCNYKISIVSRCPCLRFMLHPLKSASSFECDGCGHHASFHSMENKDEDEIRKRWEQEARDKAQREQQDGEPPRKRAREIEYSRGDAIARGRIIEGNVVTPHKRRTKKALATASTGGSRAKGRTSGTSRITEIHDDDEEYIELD